MVFFDPDGNDGYHFGINGVFIHNGFSAQGGLNIVWNFENIKINWNFGGGVGKSSGKAYGLGITGGYYTGDKSSGGNYYMVGTLGKSGRGAMVKMNIPAEDINAVSGIFPTYREIKEMTSTTDFGGFMSLGYFEGSGYAAGIEADGTIVQFGGNSKSNLNLNNQEGQAPASASNVVPPKQGVVSNTTKRMMYQVLDINERDSPAAKYEEIVGKRENQSE